MMGSSFAVASSSLNSVSFCTTHMEDPWILPSPSPSNRPIKMDLPLPVAMITYQANLDCVADPSPSSSWMEEEDRMCCLHRQLSPLMHMISLMMFFHQMKPLLRPCLGLSHLGKSYIIDHIFFPSLTVWSMSTLGRFLARISIVPWFH